MLGVRCWACLGAHFRNSSELDFFRLHGWPRPSSSPQPPLFLSSGCLLSFSCPRLGRTLERSVSALGAPLERALERLLHVARPLPIPFCRKLLKHFWVCASALQARSGSVLYKDARSGALCLPAGSALWARSAGAWRARYRCALGCAGSTI